MRKRSGDDREDWRSGDDRERYGVESEWGRSGDDDRENRSAKKEAETIAWSAQKEAGTIESVLLLALSLRSCVLTCSTQYDSSS